MSKEKRDDTSEAEMSQSVGDCYAGTILVEFEPQKVKGAEEYGRFSRTEDGQH